MKFKIIIILIQVKKHLESLSVIGVESYKVNPACFKMFNSWKHLLEI